MMATSGAPGRSASANTRPCRIGTPIASKYSGVTPSIAFGAPVLTAALPRPGSENCGRAPTPPASAQACAPAALTAGSRRIRSSTASAVARWLSALANRAPDSARSARTAPAGLNPRSTCCRLMSDCTSSPAPVARTTALATCTATSVARSRPRAACDVAPRAPSDWSVVCGRTRDARSAGNRPQITPVSAETLAVNTSTSRLSDGSITSGNSYSPRASRMPHRVSNAPTRPPAKASSRLSVSNWRTRRVRPAPSATRTAISWARRVPRASRMLAMLAQAISSTKATAPCMSRNAPCESCPCMRVSWVGNISQPRLVAG